MAPMNPSPGLDGELMHRAHYIDNRLIASIMPDQFDPDEFLNIPSSDGPVDPGAEDGPAPPSFQIRSELPCKQSHIFIYSSNNATPQGSQTQDQGSQSRQDHLSTPHFSLLHLTASSLG